MSPDEISGGREPERRPHPVERRPRHRVVGVAATVVLAAAAVSALVLTRSPSRHPSAAPVASSPSYPPIASSVLPTTPTTPPGPPVGTVPVGSDGVALLSDPGPEVLDVTGGRAATLAFGSRAGVGVDLSADGRYVAAISGADESTVEILDMSDDVVWTGPGTSAAWSPLTDTLAVLGGPSGLQLLQPKAHGYEADRPGVPTGDPSGGVDLAWSTDGRLALGVEGRIVVVDEHGEVLAASQAVRDALPEPVAWAGDRLLVFDRTGSGSIDSDGVDVRDATVSGDRVMLGPLLGEGLPEEDWWHAVGGDEVLGTLGPYRYAASDKRVVRCDLATARCTTLAGDSGASTFDAVPTASGIAYLSTPNAGDSDGGLTSAELVLAESDGADAHAATGAPAATQIVAMGNTLLLVAVSGARASIDRYDGGAVSVLVQVAAGAGLYEVETPEIAAWWRPGRAVVR